METIESTFAREGQPSRANALLAKLPEEDHLIVFGFFHMLRGRAAIRTMSLTMRETEMQVEAISRRVGIAPGNPIPVTAGLFHFCSIAGCNKRKTPVAQVRVKFLPKKGNPKKFAPTSRDTRC